MAQRYYALMRNRYSSERDHPVERYRDYEWDGELFLMTYVTEFYSKWMNAYAYGGATHHEGIQKLIHTLPSPWSEWTAQASQFFIWYSPLDYTARGDLVGLIKVLLPAMTAAFDGPPRDPPPHIYPPGTARMRKYRCDEEPRVSRVPKTRRLGMRVAAPQRSNREVNGRFGMTPPPAGVEEESEEEDPEEEDPVEEEDPIRESVGETEEKEDEDGRD
ncbi:uncharacterized protein LOC121746479 [Salvia splendens]|uniref:uncharacterized protein LOC121746478 n=1 Tax=Salvia splendens TaxID=180675 RepID=UPI001C275164|nr:uncharacterized protein LOC121746478 [Salvia splendens]XP_041996262.1 uncharacterized protein LOC121746479 [Salvia splendens]